MDDALEIRADDLSDPAVRALIEAHLTGMHESSPPESVHALGADRLAAPGIAFFSARLGGELAGIGALATLDAERGEVKSMRVAEPFVGRGVGRRMLRHLLEIARSQGLSSVWLETGSTADFAPAVRLYESEGFVVCGPFGDYSEDPFSVFMTRGL